jgi:hypothetical protein
LRLDAVENSLTPGHGNLNLGFGADRVTGAFANVGVEALIREGFSAFAQGQVSFGYDHSWDYSGLAGLRFKW